MLAISSSERIVRCRIFKSRTVDRMVFSAEGLTAGVKLQNSSLFRELLTFRGRNWYPKKGASEMWGDRGACDMIGRLAAGWGFVDGVGLALG
jgi:hypothetical protein